MNRNMRYNAPNRTRAELHVKRKLQINIIKYHKVNYNFFDEFSTLF